MYVMLHVKLRFDLSCRTTPVIFYHCFYFVVVDFSNQLGAQSVVHLCGQNLRNENDQINSVTGVLLMIFQHKHHTTFSELQYVFTFSEVIK